MKLLRCIHIGLLCVQEDATARPNLSAGVLMLNSNSINLPAPSPPAYYFDSGMESSFQALVHSLQGNHSEEVPPKFINSFRKWCIINYWIWTSLEKLITVSKINCVGETFQIKDLMRLALSSQYCLIIVNYFLFWLKISRSIYNKREKEDSQFGAIMNPSSNKIMPSIIEYIKQK